ncbi:hypothetical protein [Dyella silvatica]|uniref:hypothetical protein n=1 Tax=Dyella silvatica TaxID=2992128 RepID=UPI00225A0567|nr:hypothetical protein [Dyella silvatica]
MNDAIKRPASRRLTYRSASLILGALSVVFPAAYFTMQSRAFAQWAAAQDGPVCGMPMLAALFLSVALMFVLALLAALWALLSYRRLPRMAFAFHDVARHLLQPTTETSPHGPQRYGFLVRPRRHPGR